MCFERRGRLSVNANDRSKRWKIARSRLLRALSEEYKTITALSEAIGLPSPTVRTWVSSTTVPTLPNLMQVEKFFSIQPELETRSKNLATLMGPPTRRSAESVKRKAELIAEHLEVAMSIMKWFVTDATEDERDVLRQVLGTEGSYEAFNLTRALLTEAHYTKLIEGQANGDKKG